MAEANQIASLFYSLSGLLPFRTIADMSKEPCT